MKYSYTTSLHGGSAVAAGLIGIVLYVIYVIGLWKMFVKAGHPGWAAIIPIYNLWIWLKIAGRPASWFWVAVAAAILSWIPVVGWILGVVWFVMYLLSCFSVSRNFGHDVGYGIGLWLLPFIFVLILGFGGDRYTGARA
jgi:hypothetical protein